ncbi:MAG: hemerythrin domain-containing protein [Thermoguttaceae bacterium]
MTNDPDPSRPRLESQSRDFQPRQIVAEISGLFREPADAITRLQQRLDLLAEQLSLRFASEEQSGRYVDALGRAPWLTARIQELQQQHQQLVASLRHLRELCQSSTEANTLWPRAQQEFADFADLLLEHEASESNLLEEAHPGPNWCQE